MKIDKYKAYCPKCKTEMDYVSKHTTEELKRLPKGKKIVLYICPECGSTVEFMENGLF